MASNGVKESLIDQAIGGLTAADRQHDRRMERFEHKLDLLDGKVDTMVTDIALIKERLPAKTDSKEPPAKNDSIIPAGGINKAKLAGVLALLVTIAQAVIEALK